MERVNAEQARQVAYPLAISPKEKPIDMGTIS
jgi:hypothetical protein